MRNDGLVRRWLSFNGIGMLGMGVQLLILALLVHVAHVHYLVATVIALEVTLLHNFVWHQRWTWQDRRADSRATTVRRLVHFHALNGLVSLAGNAGGVWLLTGRA